MDRIISAIGDVWFAASDLFHLLKNDIELLSGVIWVAGLVTITVVHFKVRRNRPKHPPTSIGGLSDDESDWDYPGSADPRAEAKYGFDDDQLANYHHHRD